MTKARGITEAEIAEGIAAAEWKAASEASRAYLRESDWPVIREAERFLVREGYLTAEFGKERDAARERVR